MPTSSDHALDPFDPQSDSGKPEVILAAALYLMSAYSRNGGCPKLAHVILRHLELLAARHDIPPVLACTCAQLTEQWEQTLRDALPRARLPAVARVGGYASHAAPKSAPPHPAFAPLNPVIKLLH